jgi:hypothetical protein
LISTNKSVHPATGLPFGAAAAKALTASSAFDTEINSNGLNVFSYSLTPRISGNERQHQPTFEVLS